MRVLWFGFKPETSHRRFWNWAPCWGPTNLVFSCRAQKSQTEANPHSTNTHLLPFRTVLSRMKNPNPKRLRASQTHTHNIDKTLTKVSGAQTDGVGWVSGHCSSEVWQLARRTREHLKSHMNPMVLLWYYSRRKCCSTPTVSPKGASHLL